MYTVMKWCCGMPLGTGVGLGRMELAVAHTEFRAQGIRGTWPDLCCVLVPHENAAKKTNRSDITPDPGGHRPQRPFA